MAKGHSTQKDPGSQKPGPGTLRAPTLVPTVPLAAGDTGGHTGKVQLGLNAKGRFGAGRAGGGSNGGSKTPSMAVAAPGLPSSSPYVCHEVRGRCQQRGARPSVGLAGSGPGTPRGVESWCLPVPTGVPGWPGWAACGSPCPGTAGLPRGWRWRCSAAGQWDPALRGTDLAVPLPGGAACSPFPAPCAAPSPRTRAVAFWMAIRIPVKAN